MDIKLKQRKYKKVDHRIFCNKEEASVEVARKIVTRLEKRNKQGKKTVLGLATGSTPLLVYKELIRIHKEEGVSFKNVITFNLDEYFPMQPDDINSYVQFMNENLFDHIDIERANINIPDGTIDEGDIDDFCNSYEAKIDSYGGIDIQLLGIGRNGHIGFNEPGSGMFTKTRKVILDSVTMKDAGPAFGGFENVPTKAITMGVQTILKSKKIYIMAWGEGKAPATQYSIEEEITDVVPASFLQHHSNCTFVLDTDAAKDLTAVKLPWLANKIEWDCRMMVKAVTWLSLEINKPILKLTNSDYQANGLGDLIDTYGSAYNLNIKIFNKLQHTITGWPGGKPNADDTNRPVPSEPAQKKVLVFSPHPDDDVISMGGTYHRLAKQGHDMHVAYQVSGDIAVSDTDLLHYLRLIKAFNLEFLGEDKDSIVKDIADVIKARKEGEFDSAVALKVKGMIRRVEALNASNFIGVDSDNIKFLNLPFYNTGKVEKNPLGADDIRLVAEYLNEIKPQQIYAAADLEDPHGTHAVCFEVIIEALKSLEGEAWLEDCVLWGYRGAWAEWPVEDIDMAVPLSPDELDVKIKSIFMHSSQKDNVMFPGADIREFWERARDRNHSTADMYDKLGLASYEAMEVFSKYDYRKA